MRKKVYFLLSFLLLLCVACSTEQDPSDDSGEKVLVKLNPTTLEITQGSDVPFSTKSSSTDSTIYAIQVYENDSPYYYGLFDDPSKIEIVLTSNNTYKFKIAAYQKGTGSGLKYSVNNGVKKYYLPKEVALDNKFNQGDVLTDINKLSSIKLNGQNIQSTYPEIDAFYNEKSIVVTKELSSIDLPLARMGFGVLLNIDGLTSGKIYVSLGNDTIEFTPTKTGYSSIRCYKSDNGDFSAILKSADTYSESININAKWIGSNGTEKTTQMIAPFKRNYQKAVFITLNSAFINIGFEKWGNYVTDVDGNVYNTVIIGTQTWMVENLKTTKYNDGTAIPNVTVGSSWHALTTPAYCWNNNDISSKERYGALYNWYAASSPKLAPTGWHVATSNDWTILINYLGGKSVAGGKLKEAGTTHWNAPNTGATNESGFTALPCAQRNENGVFSTDLGTLGIWWTASSSSSLGVYVNMNNGDSSVGIPTYFKYDGFAVRCVKD